MSRSVLIAALSRAFLAGEQTVEQVRERAEQTLGHPWRWLGALAKRYVAAFEGKTRPGFHQVTRFVRDDAAFRRVRHRRLSIARWTTGPQVMLPVSSAESWNLPPILSAGELGAWLGLMPSELDWYADLKGLTTRSNAPEALRHYRIRVLEKGSGGVRVIEAPKERLKAVQRKILSDILGLIPPHDAAHGFRPARSIKSFVSPHAGQRVVLRMDLHDFFPSISFGRVSALFRTAGYPDAVATLLAGLSTTTSPLLNERRHLPQGAPRTPRTQKITLSLTGGWDSDGNQVRIDSCHMWLYIYDRWLGPARRKRSSASIAHAICFGMSINSPTRSNNWLRTAPFRRVKPIVTFSKLSS